jgi:SAM-dependent methyltransferase
MDDGLLRVRAAFDRDPELEWQRLEIFPRSRLEYAIVSAALARHLPPPDPTSRVLDAGGGPGRYTVALARAGHQITLLDLSPRLLDRARQHLGEAGPEARRNVAAIVEGSITDLSRFPDGHFTAVICLGGVLSFLLDATSRRDAIAELTRVTQPDGLLFLAVLNRLGGLRGILELPPSAERLEAAQTLAATGISTLEMLQLPAYWFLPGEVDALLESEGFTVVRRYGAHGVAAHVSDDALGAVMDDPEQWRAWRELLLSTADEPSVIGLSYHLLAVARRQTKPSAVPVHARR